MKVIKRSGKEVSFNKERIIVAIQKAIADTNKDPGINYDLEKETFPHEIAKDIMGILKNRKNITVENIQDLVEISLMREAPMVAKNYILYREKRNQERGKVWELDDLQRDILENKYFYNDENFEQFIDRVADGNERFKKAIQKQEFLPAGRILAGRGLYKHGQKVTYSNCFVIGKPEDNLESIFDVAKKMARTYSYGGGCGTTLSSLRPSGAKVNNAAKETTGSLSFADLYSVTTGIIGQKNRRGALMLTLSVSHPDIYEFVNAKNNLDKITKANISIEMNDEFMNAALNHKSYELKFVVKDTKEEIKRTIDAHDLLLTIAKNANDWGEPGMLFWDRIENWHLNSEDPTFKYESTNPCGEKPLPKGGSCLLGSINLNKVVIDEFKDSARVDYRKVEELTRLAVDYLDETLEEGIPLLPLEEQRECVTKYRQLGVGVLGTADLFVKLKIRYGSDESIEVSKAIAKTMINAALQQSALRAKDLGTYPAYDKKHVLKSPFLNAVATKETMELVKKHGVRNAELLSIAPTGSISTLVGASGGIEPFFSLSYTRKSETLKGEDTYYKVFTSTVKKYMEENGIKKEEDLPDFFNTAMNLDYKERIKVQAAWQYYVDSAISSTINLPESATPEHVEHAYMLGWQAGLKGLTVFRNNCKRIGILTTNPKKEIKEEAKVEIEIPENKLPELKWDKKEEVKKDECST